jgi:hypothetical protein
MKYFEEQFTFNSGNLVSAFFLFMKIVFRTTSSNYK